MRARGAPRADFAVMWKNLWREHNILAGSMSVSAAELEAAFQARGTPYEKDVIETGLPRDTPPSPGLGAAAIC